MASATIANLTEVKWPESRGGATSGGAFRGKTPFSSSRPKFGKKHKARAPSNDVNGYFVDQLPAVTQSASDDAASSINRKPGGANFNYLQYRSFDLASYSCKELNELRLRLNSELEQIRQLKSRIESGDIQLRPIYDSQEMKMVNENVLGKKRSLPSNLSNDVKKTLMTTQSQSFNPKNADMIKSCRQILSKLMKHKNGYIFNSPVNVKRMKLDDYYLIVKNPMDLGSVKSKLARNLYASPTEFAADVRLTFSNAMLYNPKGHYVYAMADQLLTSFEELFLPLNEKFHASNEQPQRLILDEDFQASSSNHSKPEGENKPNSPKKMKNQVQARVSAQPQVQTPVRTPEPVQVQPVKSAKLPKPRAKDTNKREMTMEEKHKLGIGLQSLPQEKMEQVVHIVRKRNGHLAQDGDEIELDIEVIDTETLWELDRFVTNWKKLVSKIKRQGLLNNWSSNGDNEELPVIEMSYVPNDAKKDMKVELVEEDVDICDDMPMSNFPSVEIEKDEGRPSSSSSSSGSDSSSSSDSGSSGSDDA